MWLNNFCITFRDQHCHIAKQVNALLKSMSLYLFKMDMSLNTCLTFLFQLHAKMEPPPLLGIHVRPPILPDYLHKHTESKPPPVAAGQRCYISLSRPVMTWTSAIAPFIIYFVMPLAPFYAYLGSAMH